MNAKNWSCQLYLSFFKPIYSMLSYDKQNAWGARWDNEIYKLGPH